MAFFQNQVSIHSEVTRKMLSPFYSCIINLSYTLDSKDYIVVIIVNVIHMYINLGFEHIVCISNTKFFSVYIEMEIQLTNTHIVMDALNFLTRYFCPNFTLIKTPLDVWTYVIEEIDNNIKKLIHAARNTGCTLHFVVDSGFQSDEAKSKWVGRRENEVKFGSRLLPLETDVILCETLRKYQQLVYCPVGLDADDIVVKLAIFYNGHVLSEDKDMFRYTDFNSEYVFSNFIIEENTMLFVQADATKIKRTILKRSTSDLPLEIDKWLLPYNKLDNPDYVRGCCSPVVKQFGNTQGISRPLRSAIYSILKLEHKFERWPEWSERNKQVYWVNNNNTASKSLIYVFKTPFLALEWLENNDPSFYCHFTKTHGENPLRVFARIITCAGLYSYVSGEPMLDVLESLKPTEQKICRVCSKPMYMTTSHKQWFESKGLSQPGQCKQCKRKK